MNMKLKINVQGKEYKVEIEEINKEKTKIKLGKEEFVFEEKSEEKEKIEVAKTSFPKRDFRRKEIKAPIAGLISGVFVKDGDFIKKGKKVVLLSAMKMENEIISDFAGKIKNVLVKNEQKVKEGDILITLD